MHKEAQTETLQNLNLSIDNYVKDNLSICREERQYALYLSNVLRYYGKNPSGKPANRIGNDVEVKKIFIACGFKENELDNVVIENVFYEATFMRDFFERNRRINLSKPSKKEDVCLQKTFKRSSYVIKDKEKSFNRKLLCFCWEKIGQSKKGNEGIDLNNLDGDIKEYNYGRNEIPDKFQAIKKLVQAMMNSKPDLAVIYHYGENAEKKKLLFLECKFESSEDKTDGDNGEKYTQRKMQGYIAEFLCNIKDKYLTDVETSEIMVNEEGKSKLVRFDRNDETTNNISIKNLIEVEKRIFEKH